MRKWPQLLSQLFWISWTWRFGIMKSGAKRAATIVDGGTTPGFLPAHGVCATKPPAANPTSTLLPAPQGIDRSAPPPQTLVPLQGALHGGLCPLLLRRASHKVFFQWPSPLCRVIPDEDRMWVHLKQLQNIILNPQDCVCF